MIASGRRRAGTLNTFLRVSCTRFHDHCFDVCRVSDRRILAFTAPPTVDRRSLAAAPSRDTASRVILITSAKALPDEIPTIT
jgi:hypothetical protein